MEPGEGAEGVEIFKPCLDMLPESQQQVWRQLDPTPRHFVLYGGTALALRLGHRASVDFDFFSCASFQPFDLIRSIDYLKDQTVTQQAENTLSCEIETRSGIVKISFFGSLPLKQINPPDRVETNGIAIASLIDLFGMKCATIPQRNEAKDYQDIHALVTRAKLDLSAGIAAARAIYGRQYNPILTLQALVYFADLPDALPKSMQSDLIAAVKSVSLQDIPPVTATGKLGEGFGQA